MKDKFTYFNFPLHFLTDAIANPEYFQKILSYGIMDFVERQPKTTISDDEFIDNSLLKKILYCYNRNRDMLSYETLEELDEFYLNEAIVGNTGGFDSGTGEFEPEELDSLNKYLVANPEIRKIIDYDIPSITYQYVKWKFDCTLASMESNMQIYEELKAKNKHFEEKFGTDAYVSIKADLLFAVADGRFPIEEFVFLCAIKTIIGKRNYNRTYRKSIAQRACGAVNKNVFKMYRYSISNFYEKYSIRHWSDKVLDSLSRRELISRISAGRGFFITTSLTLEELIDKIKLNRKKYNEKKKKEKLMNKKLSEELKWC